MKKSITHVSDGINKQDILSAMKLNGVEVISAARKLNISRNTFYYHLKRNPIDPAFIKSLEEACNITITTSVIQAHTPNKNTDVIFEDSERRDFENEDLSYREKNNDVVKPSGQITSINSNRRKRAALIPFYNADFMAGMAEEFYDDATIYPEYYMDVPEFSGCTAFRAYSDSMDPRIKSGNILFGIKIPQDKWKMHLEYGQIYGITCKDGRRYLKYVRRAQNDREFFLLKSENENYDDFELPKDEIRNLWLIEGWLDKRT